MGSPDGIIAQLRLKRCLNGGYDLRGSRESDLCPGCGADIAEAEIHRRCDAALMEASPAEDTEADGSDPT